MLGMFSNNIRIVSVNSVDYSSGIATTTWEDQTGEEGPKIKIPHPFIGNNGEGIFVGLQPGALVAVGMLSSERPIALGVISSLNNVFDIAAQQEASFDFSGQPPMASGEVILKGPMGSMMKLDRSGTISVENAHGEGNFLYNMSSNRCSIENLSPVKYIVSQSGIKVEGIIRRDLWASNQEEYMGILNPYDESYFEDIGWDVSKVVSQITRDEEQYRNPSLAENREIFFEYGRDYFVGTYEDEVELRSSPEYQKINDTQDRRERRNNVLSLSLTYPNELIENSKGTMVDVFGNILNINKKTIGVPVGENEREFLDNVFENMRHSVAYHMAINTRKGWAYREDARGRIEGNSFVPTLLKNGVPDVNDFSNNIKDRSKWEINVDKEGLTVINIPATSETGTIPRLTRYETSSVLSIDEEGNFDEKNPARSLDDSKKVFRNSKNKDIFIEQVGPGGIEIVGEQIENRAKNKPTTWTEEELRISPEFIQAGTAFHDIRKTANLVLERDINAKAFSFKIVGPELPPNPDPEDAVADPDAVSSEINSSLPDYENNKMPNAGGRSAVLNLDGSLETSIGANTIDRVSWTLDTAGAVIARLGRDKQGRSAVIQSDGYVAIEIGGWDFVGEKGDDLVDTRFVGQGIPRVSSLEKDPYRFKSGKLTIRIRRANSENPSEPDSDKNDHLLIIDDTGITIKSAGVLNLISKQELTLQSESNICLNAPNVIAYENSPLPRYIRRGGRDI